MRTLLVDNHDSFTYNLFHLLAEVNGVTPVVLCNDDYDAWRRLTPGDFDNVVISPGPGRPDRERDFGLSRLALELYDVPLLGICLGHQGLCCFAGGVVTHAPEPVHGRHSAIHHTETELFDGIPSPFQAIRYHSLVARELPAELETTAVTPDGLIMAVRHRQRPHWGVQFHPESIASEHGARLLANFRDLTGKSTPVVELRTVRPPEPEGRVRQVAVDVLPDAAAVFERLFADNRAAFWLDGWSGFSILGAARELVSYDVAAGLVTVEDDAGRLISEHRESLFDYLARELAARGVADAGLPCEFNLGYVGYLGYEMKADCGGAAAHRSPVPDGCLAFVDRAVVIDHRTGGGWLLALDSPDWPRWAATVLADLPTVPPASLPAATPVDFSAWHDLDRYRELVLECQRLIADGESYEICLTNQLETSFHADPFRAYQVLRRVNPAPYAAFLALPECAVLSSSPERFLRIGRDGIVESKPIKGTRPRGADAVADAALAAELRSSAKDRAENLMIVDLVRHDLGRSAEVGSVRVPALFDVESYPTVHQLVSTVQATLRADVSSVECVRAAFPGGSMTGAPKVRTMEIIDRLEGRARGIYSGALGYFSLNGAVDLSIVIRTIVVRDGVASLGVGGAIVAGSNPDDEVEETMVKARALLHALSVADAELATR